MTCTDAILELEQREERAALSAPSMQTRLPAPVKLIPFRPTGEMKEVAPTVSAAPALHHLGEQKHSDDDNAAAASRPASSAQPTLALQRQAVASPLSPVVLESELRNSPREEGGADISATEQQQLYQHRSFADSMRVDAELDVIESTFASYEGGHVRAQLRAGHRHVATEQRAEATQAAAAAATAAADTALLQVAALVAADSKLSVLTESFPPGSLSPVPHPSFALQGQILPKPDEALFSPKPNTIHYWHSSQAQAAQTSRCLRTRFASAQ